jgi:hypothetical protein
VTANAGFLRDQNERELFDLSSFANLYKADKLNNLDVADLKV